MLQDLWILQLAGKEEHYEEKERPVVLDKHHINDVSSM